MSCENTTLSISEDSISLIVISVGVPTFPMSSEPGALKNFEESEKKTPIFPSSHFLSSGSFDATEEDEALQLVGVEAK